jgi:predicted  nucleic acid-binding Zn-ribbon protein
MSEQRENTLMLKLETVIPEWSQLSSVDTAEGLSAIVVVTLLALFGASLLFALREFWLSNSRVSELQNLLSNADRETLAERRRELRHAAESETKSGKLWREFDESLVLVESQSRLFNTIDAAHFFNTHSLARGLTENRLLAAMPGILTAIGVVGTFAGLQMGLASLSTSVTGGAEGALDNEVLALKNGIFAMIAGASIAFMTSLWGVLLSVVFNFIEKSLERITRRKISQLQNTVDFLYPRITAEQSLVNIEQSTLQSKDTLSGLDEKIGHRLQEAMTTAAESMKAGISDSLHEVLAPAVQQLVNNAHQGSERALDGLMTEFLSKIGTAGKEQQDALLSTASAVQTASGEINQGVEGLIEKLDAFLVRQEAVALSFESVSESNQAASAELRASSVGLKEGAQALATQTQNLMESGQRLGEVVTSAATNIADSTQALSSINEAHQGAISRLREIFGGISELDDRLKNVSTQAGSDMRAVQENTAAVLELLQEQMNVFEGRMLQFSDQQERALQRTTETVASASSGVTGQVDALLEKVSTTLQSNIESADTFRSIADANASAASQLSAVASALSQSANNLAGHNESMASATAQLKETTAAAASKVEEAGRAMSSVTSAQQNATSQISQLTQNVQEVSRQMETAGDRADQGLTRVNEHFERVSGVMKQHITDLETQLAQLLNEYASQVQSQTTDRLNVWNAQTQEYVGAMSDAVQALAGVVDEIEHGQGASRAGAER